MANNFNTTKEQERAELHRAIWQIANDLRGSVDGWDFKQYVLGILFYRFISENLTNYINTDERRVGKKDFDYATLSNKEAEFGRADTVKEKGFYILPSQLFVNVRKNARNDANFNETLTKVFPQRARLTSLLRCTCFRGFLRVAQPRLLNFPACSIAVAQRARFVNI